MPVSGPVVPQTVTACPPLRSTADPGGNIILAVAENRLTSDVLRPRLRAAASEPLPAVGAARRRTRALRAAALPSCTARAGRAAQDAFSYPHPRGTPRLRQAFAGYLNATFMQAGAPVLARPRSPGAAPRAGAPSGPGRPGAGRQRGAPRLPGRLRRGPRRPLLQPGRRWAGRPHPRPLLPGLPQRPGGAPGVPGAAAPARGRVAKAAAPLPSWRSHLLGSRQAEGAAPQARNGVEAVPWLPEAGAPLTRQLDAAVAAAAARGVAIRALLITHPDNPTGASLCRPAPCAEAAAAAQTRPSPGAHAARCQRAVPAAGKLWAPADLAEMLHWCCEHGIHFVRCGAPAAVPPGAQAWPEAERAARTPQRRDLRQLGVWRRALPERRPARRVRARGDAGCGGRPVPCRVRLEQGLVRAPPSPRCAPELLRSRAPARRPDARQR